jgi:hypothetical protein
MNEVIRAHNLIKIFGDREVIQNCSLLSEKAKCTDS